MRHSYTLCSSEGTADDPMVLPLIPFTPVLALPQFSSTSSYLSSGALHPLPGNPDTQSTPRPWIKEGSGRAHPMHKAQPPLPAQTPTGCRASDEPLSEHQAGKLRQSMGMGLMTRSKPAWRLERIKIYTHMLQRDLDPVLISRPLNPTSLCKRQ